MFRFATIAIDSETFFAPALLARPSDAGEHDGYVITAAVTVGRFDQFGRDLLERSNLGDTAIDRVCAVECVIDRVVDRVIANPPYLVDERARAYRDGGGDFGAALSLRITHEALARLAPGGSLLLYTGAAVVDGVDTFRRDVVPIIEGFNASYTYVEIDPDVFGEELGTSAYAAVDRIAAVALRVTLEGR